MGLADFYSPKKKGRVRLRPQTPASSKYGGRTGHHAGAKGGMHAASPHNGMHAGPNRGRGFQGGRHPAPPFSGKHTRTAGQPDTYAAAGPQQGFITGARGNFGGNGPGGNDYDADDGY